MKLNRKLQFEILTALQKVYPDSLLVQALPDFSQERDFMASLFYLQEHNLIEGGDIREPGKCRSMVDVQITKYGLDFLADDGGPQAILGNMIIKFEKREIIAALHSSVEKSDLDEQKRRDIANTLTLLETEELKRTVLQLISAGGIEAIEKTLPALAEERSQQST